MRGHRATRTSQMRAEMARATTTEAKLAVRAKFMKLARQRKMERSHEDVVS